MVATQNTGTKEHEGTGTMRITMAVTPDGEMVRIQRDGTGRMPWTLYTNNPVSRLWECAAVYPTRAEALADYDAVVTRTIDA